MSESNFLRILLLGDSTVLGSVPRLVAPKADHLEELLRKLLSAVPGFPPTRVINKGQDNDTIERMLANRYDADVGQLESGLLDHVFIRFGINDRSYLRDWASDFPRTYHELIARVRRDQPRARIALETIIPYRDPESTAEVNAVIRRVAKEEGLPVCDTHAKYAEALRRGGPDTLNYRRIALADIPAAARPLISDDLILDSTVVVLDNRLDAQLGHLPAWFGDRHCNLAGFHVVAQALADYLAGAA
ncbi:MAG: GDSL-type esterase/lipase family protein [Planctomycetota bacterium]|nr:GDSL-type esterase/lipase family protein [Planctomycetota bacterium]